jgi:site-specific recombinase XerD
MLKKTETRVEFACRHINGFFEVTTKMEQYILISGLSKATYESYCRKLAELSLYFNKLPQHISEIELTEYLAFLVTKAKSPSQTEFKHMVYGMRFYFKALNLTMKVRLPIIKDDKKLPIVLSKQECFSIINQTKNFKHRLILMFIYSGGLRVRELTNLKWSDVNVNRMTIHIKRSKGRKDRYVPLAKNIIEPFVQYMSGLHKSEYIFFGANNREKMSHTGIMFLLKQAVRRVGINKTGVCLHTLRHSYATHLLEDGLDIISIKELLGHESIQTTLVYLHVANCNRQQKMSPLDSLYDEVDAELINKCKIKYTELSIQRNCRIPTTDNQLDLFEI